MSTANPSKAADPAAAAESDHHEKSRVLKKKTTNDLFFLQGYYKAVAVVAILVSIPIIIMSSYWADITAKADIYTDPSSSWEACLVSADYQVIPLAELTAISTSTIRNQFITCLTQQNCSTPCLQGIGAVCAPILSSGPPVTDIHLPAGKFLNSLSYIGIQSVIFALVAHGNMTQALKKPSWLISACGMMIWFCFSIFTYYAVSPVLPVPTQTNATLMTFLYYEGSYNKFEAFNNGNNQCLTAVKYVWVYLVFLLLLAGTIVAGLVIGLYAENIRYKSPNRKHYDHLDHTELPRVLGFLAIAFYVMFAVSKMVTSYTQLNAIDDFDYTIGEAALAGYRVWFPQIWFPLAQPSVDLTTLLGICACVSILRGFTTQSVSAFQLASACSAVYAFSGWPALVGAYEFYFHNNFQNFDDCKSYFTTAPTSSNFGYPDEYQAEQYCIGFRLAMGSATGLLTMMHLISLSCAYLVMNNKKRGSFVHEQLDFETAALEYALSRNNSTTGSQPLARANSVTAFLGLGAPKVSTGGPGTGAGAGAGSYVGNPMAGTVAPAQVVEK